MPAAASIPLLFCLLICSMALPAVAAESGFLDDYGVLVADPDRAGARRYVAPDAKLAKYTKIMIAPIEFMYDPESRHKNVSPDEMKLITDALYGALVAALEPAYPVVDKPGEDVLAVRIAITNVRMENKKRPFLIGYTPIGFATTTLANVAGLRVTLKGAGIEAELLDSVSGAVVGSVVDQGAATSKTDGDEFSWDELKKTLDFYARRFRARWDAERGA